MADAATKLALKTAKKESAIKVKELNKKYKLHSEVHPVLQVVGRPLIAGVTARAAGEMDGRWGNDQNAHTAVRAGGILVPLAAIGVSFVSPTAGGLLADAGAGLAGASQYLAGQESGQKAKAKAATPTPPG
jgi:hypothetical protein